MSGRRPAAAAAAACTHLRLHPPLTPLFFPPGIPDDRHNLTALEGGSNTLVSMVEKSNELVRNGETAACSRNAMLVSARLHVLACIEEVLLLLRAGTPLHCSPIA